MTLYDELVSAYWELRDDPLLAAWLGGNVLGFLFLILLLIGP